MMYTRQERKEIYLKALDFLLKNNKSNVCCHALSVATNITDFNNVALLSIVFIQKNLPEFYLFKPKGGNPNERWFDNSRFCQEGYDYRLNALLLCIEMCNDELNK